MRPIKIWLIVIVCLCPGLHVLAQEPATEPDASSNAPQDKPRGPADIIRRAAPQPGANMPAHPAGHPAHPAGHADAPTKKQLAFARGDSEIPADTVKVSVVSPDGKPLAGVMAYLGTLKQGGNRNKVSMQSDAQGNAWFRRLKTGNEQAYRASVLHHGATFGSTPFRLSGEQGYHVQIVRYPTTQNEQSILLGMGQVMVEFRAGRLHVTQQSRLINLGAQAFVFPQSGKKIALPKEFTAFGAQKTMGDQRVSELESEGLLIEGSIPPGEATLVWAFDLPQSGSQNEFTIRLPFNTYMFRVMSEAPDGLEMQVSGMPSAQRIDDGRHRVLMTQLQRRPSDPPLSELRITLKGIPGPGPARWVAACLAIVFIGLGVVMTLGTRKSNQSKGVKQKAALGLAAQSLRETLCAEALELRKLKQRGEVGETFYQRKIEAITTQIAESLQAESQS